MQNICHFAWQVITTSFCAVNNSDSDAVIENITTVISPFTERILREILDLREEQQLDLCKRLVKGKNSKGHTFTIADQILQLMSDGRELSNEELRPHFPGKRITSALSRLKRKGAIEQVKSKSGKEIPGVHRIVKA